MRRNTHLDAQFEAVFGVSVETYWLGPVLGFDLPRFDEAVLRSGDQSVQAALEQAVTAARQRGVPFRVDAAELVLYVRHLSTGQFDYRTGQAKRAPACVNLRTYPAKAEAGRVLVQVD